MRFSLTVYRRNLLRMSLLPLIFSVMACTSQGVAFKRVSLDFLQPGITTLSDVEQRLGSPPKTIYQDPYGGFMAHWEHTRTLMTDAIYRRKELLLAFDGYGRFSHVVNAVNMPSKRQSADAAPLGEGHASMDQQRAWTKDGLPVKGAGPLGQIEDGGIDTPIVILPVDRGSHP